MEIKFKTTFYSEREKREGGREREREKTPFTSPNVNRRIWEEQFLEQCTFFFSPFFRGFSFKGLPSADVKGKESRKCAM